MGTKNNPGEFDCYANADPDEPMFVLLGRDKHAPALVWLWATMRELDADAQKVIAEARECAVSMLAWQKDHDRRAVGFAQPILAGLFELIRTVNGLIKTADNNATDLEIVRRLLAATEFEK